MLRLWKNMDEDDKARLVKTTGFVVAIFTVFTLLATVSYFFTWKVDQSALAAPVGDTSVEIRNLAGKLGYKWSNLLVRRWFGLGSLALIVILFAISVRLLLQRWHYSMLKTILLTVSGALVSSFILSFISDLFGWSNIFGGGLGGECGEAVVGWSRNLFGPVITGFLILLLLALWLFFISDRFSRWFASLGDISSDHEKDLASEDNAARGTSGGTASPASGGAERSEASEPPYPSRKEIIPKVIAKPAVSTPAVSTLVTKEAPERSEASEVPTPSGQNQPLEVIKDDTLSTEVKKELPRINVRDELPNYKFPSLELLEEYSSGHHEVTDEDLARNNNKIRATLENYERLLDAEAQYHANQADALIFPDIEAGNVFYKTITLFCGAQTAGLLQGTKAPVVLSSRADTPESKFYSLAIASI